MTVNLVFDALADAVPDLTALGPPERLRSGWFNGIKHWQVDYAGGCPGGAVTSSTETTASAVEEEKGVTG